MGGVIIHLCVGLVCGILLYALTTKLEFSLAIFLGNLMPDFVKVSGSYMYTGFVSIKDVLQTEIYHAWHEISHSVASIVVFWVFVLGLVWMLHHFHVINTKTEKEWDMLVIYLLVGSLIHVVIDLFFRRIALFL